jgi:hypothetical protein
MLTTLEKGRPIASRIKGRPALVKRLRALLIAVHRFGNRRAHTASDVLWCATLLDALTSALAAADGEHKS